MGGNGQYLLSILSYWHMELESEWHVLHISCLINRKSELELRDDSEPYIDLRGCRVCDFESDDESNFDSDSEDDDSENESEKHSEKEEIFSTCPPKNPKPDSESTIITEETRFRRAGSSIKHSIGDCDTVDVDCITNASANGLNNPLMVLLRLNLTWKNTAISSGLFSEEALDFLNLTLQWNPLNRPRASELLFHPFVSEACFK